jgi:hypothetical protein
MIESWLPTSYSYCGKPRHGAQSLAKQGNPAPAILHQEAPCLKRRIFLMRDFASLKLIRGILFKPKLDTNGLSWHTISWYYTFKNCNFRLFFLLIYFPAKEVHLFKIYLRSLCNLWKIQFLLNRITHLAKSRFGFLLKLFFLYILFFYCFLLCIFLMLH